MLLKREVEPLFKILIKMFFYRSIVTRSGAKMTISMFFKIFTKCLFSPKNHLKMFLSLETLLKSIVKLTLSILCSFFSTKNHSFNFYLNFEKIKF